MVSKIKEWLDEHGFNYNVVYNATLERQGNALIKVCFDEMPPLKVAELFTQINEWIVGGCDNATFTIVNDAPHCAFTAPLDSMYTLTYALDGTPTVITRSKDVNEIRGIMLDRYIHVRDGKHDIRRSIIGLDTAGVAFEDGAGKVHTLEWYISREFIDGDCS